MKKLLQILFVCSIVSFLFFHPIKSVDANAADTGQDFIFVIDGSYSMDTSDPQKHIFELIRYMATLSTGTENRIGYVVYNDSVIKEQGLKKIDTEKENAQMMAGLTSLTRIKGTDVGLGMKTAKRILQEGHYQANHTAMIILSDGDIDVDTANPNRTQTDTNEDINQIVTTADYPIYTIQYSEEKVHNQAPMNTWGAKTDGKNYSATSVQQLIQDATDIYSRQTKMALQKDSIAAEKKTNNTFELTVPVKAPKNEVVTEIILTLQDNARITNIVLPSDKEDITMQKSNTTAIITINSPKVSQYKITYQTKDNKPVQYQTITQTGPQKESSVSKWLIVIAGILILAFLIYTIWRFARRIQTKKQTTYFHDSLEGYFMKTPENEEIPIQNWNASLFYNQAKVTLFDLLQGTPVQMQMQASKQIWIRVGTHNHLQITNKSANVKMIRNGQPVPNRKVCLLKASESLYLIFQESGIEIELRIRKASHRGIGDQK
ncbi:VWA domain-containing protein [Listeria booriae]|uniref:vWA domain-containing protein n=1 Tax=Listeria booriae TaxID=1552123 RepID=UPI001629530A|nr:vWA domain-containing protein [Listeria booriae]MBC2020475.1 VWA domain-containing protein [Listeria booriae]